MFYPLETQNDIILACCLIHNFLREVDADDLLEEEELSEVEKLRESQLNGRGGEIDQSDSDDDEEDDAPIDELFESPEWKQYRRALAAHMYFGWRKRVATRNHR